MPTHRDVAGEQILGTRARQEDAFRIATAPGFGADLLVLADGMGGHVGGAEASRVAVDAFVEAMRSAPATEAHENALERALDSANRAVADAARAQPALRGMGTTLVGVTLADDGLRWASVGDSPLWLWREGRLARLNADHSLAGALAADGDAGGLDPAAFAEARHVLQAALMGEPLAMRDVGGHDLAAGDIVLLASDGIETLDEGELTRRVAASPQAPARELVRTILEAVEMQRAAHQDNATLVLARA